MKVICKYCLRKIDKRGMNAHMHFKHLGQYLTEFRLNPMICFFADRWPPRFQHKQLPASCDPEVGR
jgi:hypothetical protein